MVTRIKIGFFAPSAFLHNMHIRDFAQYSLMLPNRGYMMVEGEEEIAAVVPDKYSKMVVLNNGKWFKLAEKNDPAAKLGSSTQSSFSSKCQLNKWADYMIYGYDKYSKDWRQLWNFRSDSKDPEFYQHKRVRLDLVGRAFNAHLHLVDMVFTAGRNSEYKLTLTCRKGVIVTGSLKEGWTKLTDAPNFPVNVDHVELEGNEKHQKVLVTGNVSKHGEFMLQLNTAHINGVPRFTMGVYLLA